jgi:SAM-dependent methyltransferase
MMEPVSMDRLSSGNLHDIAWAEEFEKIDLQLSPLGLKAIEALNPGLGNTVLDIGCGTGQTLLQLAERVGPKGHVIGIDIAPALLEVARHRTIQLSQVKLIESDAQMLNLPSKTADAIFSRFGVMGFNDPIAAFSNFHRILKPAGVLAFSCWRSLQDNELDRFPLSAVGLQAAANESPFSFTDPDHISGTLAAAGFKRVMIRKHDEKVSSGDLDAMTTVLLKVGPLGKIVRETPTLRTTAEPLLRKALTALGDSARIELSASIWVVTARSG